MTDTGEKILQPNQPGLVIEEDARTAEALASSGIDGQGVH